MLLDDQARALRNVYPGKGADEGVAVGHGRPAPMYRIGRDGSLTPVGTVDLGNPTGGLASARSEDSEALWFFTPEGTAVVRWHGGTATRIELGGAPEVTGCGDCRLERVGQRRIVPAPSGGAVAVRLFADRSRAHKYCEVVRLSETGVRARDVFEDFCAPVRTMGAPAVMVSEGWHSVLRVLDEAGWSRQVLKVRGYEDWVAADGNLYGLERGELVRLDLSFAGLSPMVPFPELRPLAIAPAREGGLWAVAKGASAEGEGEEGVAPKPSYVLVRLERGGRTNTTPLPPTPTTCVPAAPEELADGKVVVPCRAYNGQVSAVDVLAQGQWRKLRSATAEALSAKADQHAASVRRARRLAPWLTNTSPLVLVVVHLLFAFGLRLASRGGPAAKGTWASSLLGLCAALIGAVVGWQFGVFEKHASGWWRNDSLFPSFSAEEWGLAKLTAAAAAAYLALLLSRRGALSRLWPFLAVSALVPVLAALSTTWGGTRLEGTKGAVLIALVAFGSGFVAWLRRAAATAR